MKLITICILFFISAIIVWSIKRLGSNEKYYTEKTPEEICTIWRNWKIKFDDNMYVYNPYTEDYDIIKNGKKYYEIDDMCEQFEPIRLSYKDRVIPEYLKVLYKLVGNVTQKPICTEKYSRDSQFGLWRTDANCTTRSQVLYDENKAESVSFFPNECNLTNTCKPEDYSCSIMSGKWIPYTGDYISLTEKPYINANDLQIDHTVPLQNAWINGACKWDKQLREVFSNDRTPGHLSVMVRYLNTSKGEYTPYRWLPPIGKERYISNWIAVKYRYNLKLSPYEFNILHKLLSVYKVFIPDTKIGENEPIGSSIIKFEEGFTDDLLKTETAKLLGRNFLASFPKGIYKICANVSPKNYSQNTTNDLKIVRNKLKQDNNYLQFGVLRPEIVDALSDYQMCKLFI